jgi:hypothetical protein
MKRLHLPLVIALLSVVTACGGSNDDAESPVASDGDVESTVEDGSDFTETDDASGGSTVPTEASVEVTTSDVEATTGTDSNDVDDTDDTSGDDLDADDSGDPGADDEGSVEDDLLIPLDEVDDAEVCQSFATFFNGFTQIALVAAFAEFGGENGESTDAPEADTAIERSEVVFYLGLVDEIPVLRDELPAVILDAFGPIFDRVEASPRLMADAGFSQSEMDELSEDFVTDTGGVDQSDPRLDAAAAALVDEYGTFAEVLEGFDEVDAAGQEEGDAWLADTCPELSDLLDA